MVTVPVAIPVTIPLLSTVAYGGIGRSPGVGSSRRSRAIQISGCTHTDGQRARNVWQVSDGCLLFCYIRAVGVGDGDKLLVIPVTTPALLIAATAVLEEVQGWWQRRTRTGKRNG